MMTYSQANIFLVGGNTMTIPPERRLLHMENVTSDSTVKVEVGGAREHFTATDQTIYVGTRVLRVFDWAYRTANAE